MEEVCGRSASYIYVTQEKHQRKTLAPEACWLVLHAIQAPSTLAADGEPGLDDLWSHKESMKVSADMPPPCVEPKFLPPPVSFSSAAAFCLTLRRAHALTPSPGRVSRVTGCRPPCTTCHPRSSSKVELSRNRVQNRCNDHRLLNFQFVAVRRTNSFRKAWCRGG